MQQAMRQHSAGGYQQSHYFCLRADPGAARVGTLLSQRPDEHVAKFLADVVFESWGTRSPPRRRHTHERDVGRLRRNVASVAYLSLAVYRGKIQSMSN